MSWFPHVPFKPSKPRRFNPRPIGEIRPGGATEAVLIQLRRVRVYQSKDTIVRATGKTARAVDWALIFLRREGLIERGQDPRNSRYKTYKAKDEK